MPGILGELLDLLDLIAKGGVGLNDDLPRAAEEVEIVHVERAEVDL